VRESVIAGIRSSFPRMVGLEAETERRPATVTSGALRRVATTDTKAAAPAAKSRDGANFHPLPRLALAASDVQALARLTGTEVTACT
jgi:hypothetical protein